MRILIIEDNDILRNNVKTFLEIKWMQVDDYNEYEWSVYKIMTWNYDVIILDLWLWLDDKDGLDICKEVRKKWLNIWILMLTARTLTSQKILWLDSWADDYMVKPFDYEELLARVNSLSRRNNTVKWNDIIVENIEINEDKKLVLKDKQEVELSKLEFSLLLFLAQNKWKAMTKQVITEKVWWEIDLFKESRNVDIYVWYLRKKLWKDIIQTIRWVWYIIK